MKKDAPNSASTPSRASVSSLVTGLKQFTPEKDAGCRPCVPKVMGRRAGDRCARGQVAAALSLEVTAFMALCLSGELELLSSHLPWPKRKPGISLPFLGWNWALGLETPTPTGGGEVVPRCIDHPHPAPLSSPAYSWACPKSGVHQSYKYLGGTP